MRSIVPEIRHALRVLGKSPGFAVTAVVTLALGIGASTAIFSVVDSVILKPLSYPDSGRLVALWERVWFLGPDPTGPNPHHADVWRQGATAFSGMALVRQTAGGLAFGTGHPRLVGMVIATPNLLDVLQVRPIRGRTFVPEDGIKGHDRVAILTWNVWQTVFGGDPKVVGKTVQLDDIPREVIGVLAEDFRFPGANALRAFRSKQAVSRPPEPAIFIPAVIDLSQFDWNGEYGNWVALARLKPGVTARQAESQLNSLRGRILEHFPAGDRAAKRDGFGALVQPMQEAMIGDFRQACGS